MITQLHYISSVESSWKFRALRENSKKLLLLNGFPSVSHAGRVYYRDGFNRLLVGVPSLLLGPVISMPEKFKNGALHWKRIKFCLHTLKHKALFSNSSGFKSVSEKLRFRDGLVWRGSLTVETKLCFQILLGYCRRVLRVRRVFTCQHERIFGVEIWCR